MRWKNILVLIALTLAISIRAWSGIVCAVGQSCSGTITASSTDCTVAAGCVALPLPNNTASLAVNLSGTWNETLQFEQSSNGGGTWVGSSGSPQPSGAPVTSSTANGLWRFNVSAMTNFRVRSSVYTSGIASVAIQTSLGSSSSGGGAFNSGIGPSFQDITKIATPSNPAGGVIRLYGDSTSGNLSCLTPTGTNCLVGLPTGGTIGQMIANTSPGIGAWTSNPALPAGGSFGSLDANATLQFAPNQITSLSTLIAPAFKSSSATPATSGVVRLAATDLGFCWKSSLGGADICGSKDASDNVLFTGSVKAPSFIATNNVPSIFNSPLQLTEVAAPAAVAGAAVAYEDSTSHLIKVAENNGAFSAFVLAGRANTALAAMTLDLSAITTVSGFRTQVLAGSAPALNGAIAYDSTNNNFHGGLSSADSKFANFTVTPAANNNCVKWVVSGSNYLLGDQGAACGGGSTGVPLPGSRHWMITEDDGTATSNFGWVPQSTANAITHVVATNTVPSYLNLATSNVGSNVARFDGQNSNAAKSVSTDWNPTFIINALITPATVQRTWIGMGDATGATMGASDAPAANFFGFRGSTIAGDTNWMCVSQADAAHQTATSTGVAINTTVRSFKAVLTSNTSVVCTIDGANTITISIAANLPAATQLIRFTASIDTNEAVIKNLGIAIAYVEADK